MTRGTLVNNEHIRNQEKSTPQQYSEWGIINVHISLGNL